MKKILYLSVLAVTAVSVTLASCSADEKGLDEFSSTELIDELGQRRIPDVMLDSLKGSVKVFEITTYKGSSWDVEADTLIKGTADLRFVYEYDSYGFKTLSSQGYNMVSEIQVEGGNPLNIRVARLTYVPFVNHRYTLDERHRPTVKENIEQTAYFEIKDRNDQVHKLSQGHYVGEILSFANAFAPDMAGKLVRDTARHTKEEYFYNDIAKMVTVIFSESTDKGVTFVETLKRVHPQDTFGLADKNSYDEYKAQAVRAAFESTPTTSFHVVIERDKMGNILFKYSKSISQGTIVITGYTEYKYTY